MATGNKSSGPKSKFEQAQLNLKKTSNEKPKANLVKSKWSSTKNVYVRPR